jgi:hypothetical protein
MGEIIILKWILKPIGCECVYCTGVAGNTMKLRKLINPTMKFGVVRKNSGFLGYSTA